ncbi:unnamed protein product [Closterium sp. NIES-53]
MTVAQQSIPRGSDSPRITANPAGRFGLHLIQGDAFNPRPQDSSNTPVSFADVAIPSSMHLDDLISEYLEEGDQDRDALDGLMLRTELHGVAASTTMRASHPARPILNRRLSADYLDRQMQMAEQNQLRLIQSLAAMDDSVERALYADVIAAMTDACAKLSCDDIPSQELRGSSLNAAVAGRLRAMGYDAAVCTTQWDTSPTMPEGSYEYIDVLTSANPPAPSHASASPCSTLLDSIFHRCDNIASPPPTFSRTTSPTIVTRASPFLTSASSASANSASAAPASAAVPQRFIIDVDFRAQFQIARPTREYAAALESTPLIFVGRSERLARLVEVVSGAMRGALRAQGMHVPPWRKWEYLHAKWMAAVSQRVVCEAKGVTSENFQSASGGAVGGDKEKAEVDGDGYGSEGAVIGDRDASTLSVINSPTVSADCSVDVPAAPAASPFAARAAPSAATAAPAGGFHASAVSSAIAAAAVAAHTSCQQQQNRNLQFSTGVGAGLFQARFVPARRFSALQQCARAGGF